MIDAPAKYCHRLLAPRIAPLIGTRGQSGPDIAPISNVTQVSAEPQVFAIAVNREATTFKNIRESGGFALSVARKEHHKVVWRLGDKFSGFEVPVGMTKIAASGGAFDLETSKYGPILVDATGWCECEVMSEVPADFGDHGIFLARVLRGGFNPKLMRADGTYKRNSKPLMQVVLNTFATSSDFFALPWLGKKHM